MRNLSHEATELVLHIDNTRTMALVRDAVHVALAKKVARGVYDSTKASLAFAHLAEHGAKSYAKEFAKPEEWHTIFSPSVRREVAADYAHGFDTFLRDITLDDLCEEALAILRAPSRPVEPAPSVGGLGSSGGKLSKADASYFLARANASPDTDFHALRSSQVATLLEYADKAKYRAPKNANGSRARYFHAYLIRLLARKDA